MKLLDYAHCDEPTIKLAVVNADTVRMPAIIHVCAGFDGMTPCDGRGIVPFTNKAGVTRYFCRLHHYVEKMWEYER